MREVVKGTHITTSCLFYIINPNPKYPLILIHKTTKAYKKIYKTLINSIPILNSYNPLTPHTPPHTPPHTSPSHIPFPHPYSLHKLPHHPSHTHLTHPSYTPPLAPTHSLIPTTLTLRAGKWYFLEVDFDPTTEYLALYLNQIRTDHTLMFTKREKNTLGYLNQVCSSTFPYCR